MTHNWNIKDYSKFLDLRTRPAKDLLAAVSASTQPKLVYDLGCGPGNSTILLKERWPDARVIGIDSSPTMLQEAQKLYSDISFVQNDIAEFTPIEKIDCLFANASLQWLDKHEFLLPKLFNYLGSGGVLAIQMPNNFHSPSHQVTVRLLQKHQQWQPFLKNLRYGILSKPFYELPKYYDLLMQIGANNLQLWETEYLQEMPDYQSIFDWVKGTGLKPVLEAMEQEIYLQFAKEYIAAIAQEYPLQKNGKILLPFRRIFMVGLK